MKVSKNDAIYIYAFLCVFSFKSHTKKISRIGEQRKQSWFVRPNAECTVGYFLNGHATIFRNSSYFRIMDGASQAFVNVENVDTDTRVEGFYDERERERGRGLIGH